MKTKTLLTITVLLICTLVSLNPSHAIQVTRNWYEDAFPHIAGGCLVWQGKVDGNWEIFLYQIDDGKTLQLTDNAYNDISPQTDGSYVVWVGYASIGGEIFVYDVLSKTTTQITVDSAVDDPPRIADGRVVWTSHAVTDSVEPGEIFLYDLRNGTTTNLSQSPALDDTAPRINATMITWVQGDGSAERVYVYDIDNGIVSEADDDFVWNDSPQVEGNLVVLTADDRHDREIFLRNTSLNTRQKLTENAVEDTYPCIDNGAIAWVNGTGSEAEILLVRDESEYQDYLADGFTAVETDNLAPPPAPDPEDDNDGDRKDSNGGGGGGGGGGSCFVSTVGWGW